MFQAAELQAKDYFARPFASALTRKDLVEFVVLDIELEVAMIPPLTVYLVPNSLAR